MPTLINEPHIGILLIVYESKFCSDVLSFLAVTIPSWSTIRTYALPISIATTIFLCNLIEYSNSDFGILTILAS